MTEADWLHPAAHLQWMLIHLLSERRVPRTMSGRRKLRLFACGGCRALWPLIADESLRNAVFVAERFADGGASKAELAEAFDSVAWTAADSATPLGTPKWALAARDVAVATCRPQASAAACGAANHLHHLPGSESMARSLIRCLFGNPFSPVAVDPSWRTSTAVALASSIYETHDFLAMPIPADIFEDAGCSEEVVLDHCRGGGPHARGCWVVDGVLGR